MQISYSSEGAEPINLATARSWLKAEDFSTDDDLITLMIGEIRGLAEEVAGRSFVTKTITYFETDRDIIKEWIKLPYPDHNAITSVTLDGEDVSDDSYSLTGFKQKYIKVTGTVTVSDTLNNAGLKVEYTTLATLPKGFKLAFLSELAEKYERRGNTSEQSANRLSSGFMSYISTIKVY